MVIEVVENCLTNNKYGDKVHSLRSYTYESEKENFMEAIMDHENNFDIDRIITCNDDFPGECISSEVVQYKKILEANEQPVNLWDGEEEIKIDDVHVGEIVYCENCKKIFLSYNVDNCPYCGTLKEINN